MCQFDANGNLARLLIVHSKYLQPWLTPSISSDFSSWDFSIYFLLLFFIELSTIEVNEVTNAREPEFKISDSETRSWLWSLWIKDGFVTGFFSDPKSDFPVPGSSLIFGLGIFWAGSHNPKYSELFPFFYDFCDYSRKSREFQFYELFWFVFFQIF